MQTNKNLVGLAMFIFAVFCGIKNYAQSTRADTNNHPPEVSLNILFGQGQFKWNSLVYYSIAINDKEDGSSEYDEIPVFEVLLKVVYLQDSALLKDYLAGNSMIAQRSLGVLQGDKTSVSTGGLTIMRKSTCFTCHASKGKLIGPSFEMIADRYQYNPDNIKMLTKRVQNGSKGQWGEEQMPPHPGLNDVQTESAVSWILHHGKNDDVYYLAGIKGSFRTREKPEKVTGKEVYLLVASYLDRGVPDVPDTGRYGGDILILRSDE
ncbi:MAG: hypothetical protein OEX02_02885 [Cyclobacteriaceae bacterium]|nr:hypothetical protein [Cyclobacteriaceae bacterium]